MAEHTTPKMEYSRQATAKIDTGLRVRSCSAASNGAANSDAPGSVTITINSMSKMSNVGSSGSFPEAYDDDNFLLRPIENAQTTTADCGGGGKVSHGEGKKGFKADATATVKGGSTPDEKTTASRQNDKKGSKLFSADVKPVCRPDERKGTAAGEKTTASRPHEKKGSKQFSASAKAARRPDERKATASDFMVEMTDCDISNRGNSSDDIGGVTDDYYYTNGNYDNNNMHAHPNNYYI